MDILISNRQDKNLEIGLIEELILLVLKKEEAEEESELSVSIVESDEMTILNNKYRKIDKPTDVLSFSLHGESKISKFLGDIVLCPSEAKEKAINNDIDFNEYFGLLIVHSILHLFGYSHKRDDSAKVMFDRESQILKEFDIQRKSFL